MLTAIDPLTIAIVNTTADRTGEYIGRKFAGNEESPLHNPFPLPKGASDKARGRIIRQFKKHVDEAIARVAGGGGSTEDWLICQELDRLVSLARKGPLKLRCWCKPKVCHGDIIRELIIEAFETGQVFCPDGIGDDEGGCHQVDGQDPAPQLQTTAPAPSNRQNDRKQQSRAKKKKPKDFPQAKRPPSLVNQKPCHPVAVRMFRNGEHWITGYELFDPEHCHSYTKGGSGRFSPLEIKAKQRPRPNEALVVRSGQRGKPVRRLLSDLAEVVEGYEYKSFADVFVEGKVSTIGVELVGVELAEEEDLSLGLSPENIEEFD